MKTFHVTKAWLEDQMACRPGVRRFARAFPDGLTLTDDQVTNFERLHAAGARENAWDADRDFLAWLVRQLEGHHYINVSTYDVGYGSAVYFLAGCLADAVGCHYDRSKW